MDTCQSSKINVKYNIEACRKKDCCRCWFQSLPRQSNSLFYYIELFFELHWTVRSLLYFILSISVVHISYILIKCCEIVLHQNTLMCCMYTKLQTSFNNKNRHFQQMLRDSAGHVRWSELPCANGYMLLISWKRNPNNKWKSMVNCQFYMDNKCINLRNRHILENLYNLLWR